MDEIEIKYEYGNDSMDVLNVIETIGHELRHFGLTIEFKQRDHLADDYEEGCEIFVIKRYP